MDPKNVKEEILKKFATLGKASPSTFYKKKSNWYSGSKSWVLKELKDSKEKKLIEQKGEAVPIIKEGRTSQGKPRQFYGLTMLGIIECLNLGLITPEEARKTQERNEAWETLQFEVDPKYPLMADMLKSLNMLLAKARPLIEYLEATHSESFYRRLSKHVNVCYEKELGLEKAGYEFSRKNVLVTGAIVALVGVLSWIVPRNLKYEEGDPNVRKEFEGLKKVFIKVVEDILSSDLEELVALVRIGRKYLRHCGLTGKQEKATFQLIKKGLDVSWLKVITGVLRG